MDDRRDIRNLPSHRRNPENSVGIAEVFPCPAFTSGSKCIQRLGRWGGVPQEIGVWRGKGKGRSEGGVGIKVRNSRGLGSVLGIEIEEDESVVEAS